MKFNHIVRKAKDLFNRYKVLLTYSGLAFLTVSNFLLRRDVVELKLDIRDLKNKNKDLIADMVYFNRSFEDFPLPVWQKVTRGDNFVMQYVNKSYYRQYLEPLGYTRYDYMGKTDFDIFDFKTASLFYARDLALLTNGGYQRFDESILDVDTKKREKIDVIKWRIIERKDTLIYGMVIPHKLGGR